MPNHITVAIVRARGNPVPGLEPLHIPPPPPPHPQLESIRRQRHSLAAKGTVCLSTTRRVRRPHLHAVKVTHEFAQQLSAYLAADQQLAGAVQAVLMWNNHSSKLPGDAVQVLQTVQRAQGPHTDTRSWVIRTLLLIWWCGVVGGDGCMWETESPASSHLFLKYAVRPQTNRAQN